MSDSEEQWWYDLKTGSAVRGKKVGKAVDRLGPYSSREEAERAMERVAERNENWEHDPNWTDDEED
ncbi:MAG TPA: SPOR domain-containing protein [Microlunatus sp.]|nr:SPOR domain-containing protein [Microlunatus sp.]